MSYLPGSMRGFRRIEPIVTSARTQGSRKRPFASWRLARLDGVDGDGA
jgi:hypothetical protein